MNTLFEFTKLSFENLNRHIRLADNKAKFILSLDLAVISGLIALAFKAQALNLHSASGIFLVLAFVFIFFSFVSTVFIIRPVISYKCKTSELLYWQNIEKIKRSDLTEMYKNLDEDQMMDELVEQIHFYSFFASEKYRRIKTAIYSTLLAVFCAVMAVLLLLWNQPSLVAGV
ncbi:MAG: DUF5706 domain-containing protein [Candidatus Melainabacteria bacterium]|nr:DUF5706 domain-containing protein [Candidatus Melainabacteria bacterium]